VVIPDIDIWQAAVQRCLDGLRPQLIEFRAKAPRIVDLEVAVMDVRDIQIEE